MVSVLMLLTVMHMIMNQINLLNTELRNEHQARLNYTVLSLITTEWESLQPTWPRLPYFRSQNICTYRSH